MDLGAAIASNNVDCVNRPPTKISLADIMVAGSNHAVRAWIPCTQFSQSVTYAIGTSTVALRDDGVYPDEFALDGIYSNIVRPPANIATQNSSLTHRFDVGTGSQTMFSNQVVTIKNAQSYALTSTTYNWEPVTGASAINYGNNYDDNAATVSLPFSFTFEGRSLSQIVVSTNGYVCLKPSMNPSLCRPNIGFLPFPAGRGLLFANGIIAPWADDWIFPAASDVYIKTVGVSPNRQFVVTWSNAIHYNQVTGSAGNGVSFQMVLFEGSPNFDFRYLDTTVEGGMLNNPNTGLPYSLPSGGATGSAGIQMSGGGLGTRYVYGTNSLIASTAVRWTPTSSSFGDVNPASSHAPSIEALKGAYVTNGCAPGAYCPTNLVTRAEMAAFISRATYGHDLIFGYSSVPTANFNDVLSASSFFNYINTMKYFGITTGCGGSLYCPTNNVTRAEMATFLVRAVRGSAYSAPPLAGIFTDVNPASAHARNIEEVQRMSVTKWLRGG
ncbi:MAG: S-layer homology domain-containing protein, partial [Anaerolineae bacterium]|nr:S-layer homology domain-containing protein [Anaerolineae bacterium]